MEHAKGLYAEVLGAPGSEELDRINRMDRISSTSNPIHPVHPVHPVNPVNPVQSATSLSAAPDGQKLLEFVSMRLSSAPEESDAVHDLLAHLAERMIGMNKEKNAEIKGFLHWLEGEIGAPVEELTNKTALKEYYAHGFDAFAGALAKNRKKLKEGYDPRRGASRRRGCWRSSTRLWGSWRRCWGGLR